MGKKKRNTPAEKVEEPLGENWATPFADLKIEVEEPPAPPPPPPPTREERQSQALSDEDQALLKAFGGAAANGSLSRSNMNMNIERVWFSHERKGRGGKEVTLVHGLEGMDTMAQMELCARIKADLGIGGQFADGVLMLQGEQIVRATAWFEHHGFALKKKG